MSMQSQIAQTLVRVLPQVRAEIFFGGTIPGTAALAVGDNAFQDFLARNVNGFPGYTVLDGEGHWNGGGRWQGKERTRVLVIYGPNSAPFRAEIRKIARAYREEFDQDAVALAFTPAAFYMEESDDMVAQKEEATAP